MWRFAGHGGGAAVAFSPDGRRALTGDGYGSVRLWDCQTGERLGPFEVYKGGVNRSIHSLAFSPDGKQVPVGGPEDHVRLWMVPKE